MTVARSHRWLRQPDSKQISTQRKERSPYPAKGLQVAATLLALRIGFKLAKTAVGKLFPDIKASHEDVDIPQQGDSAFEQQATLTAEEGAAVAARDQWVISAEPAPAVPDGFKLVASEHLPISVYHFYEQFLSIETTCLQDHHKSTGQYNFRYSRWKADGDARFSRQFDFMQPKKGVCSCNAHCLQEQRFSVHPGGIFVMTTDMYMEDIPYADCFKVQSFWKAEPDATGMGTNVSIHVAVPFLKRCLVKSIINNTTMNDCKTFFSDFLSKVQNSITNELLPSAAAAAVAAEQLLGTSPSNGMSSPFANADAEVFIHSHGPSSTNSTPAKRGKHQQHGQHHRRGSQQQMQLQSMQQQQRTAAVEAERLLSRTVSAKPSFAQPISELRLPSRSPRHEFLSGAQIILVLLVLMIQLWTLYDNMVLHGRLAAAAPCWLAD